jgi:hypothetical protein
MTRPLALLLLAGSLLLLVCGAFHPILPLTGQGDLTMIAMMPSWKLVHLGLLYATGMIIAGIWCRMLVAEEGRAGLGVAFVVLCIGETLNGVNIGFMAGAGTEFARLHASGAEVAQVYQAGHLAAVMFGKLGGFLVSLAAGMIAMVTSKSGTEPRWLVATAWVACGVGLLGNLFAPAGHPAMLAGIGLMAVWQVGASVRLLRK